MPLGVSFLRRVLVWVPFVVFTGTAHAYANVPRDLVVEMPRLSVPLANIGAQVKLSARAYFDAAGDLMKAERFSEALVACEMALSMEPNFAEALVVHGLLTLTSRPDEAFADLTRAVQLDPANPRFLVAHAIGFLAQGDRKAAAADIDRALKLDPDNKAALEIGLMLLAVGLERDRLLLPPVMGTKE